MPDWVFGYGSLVAGADRPATLRGHRRCWGVAMDNRRTIPGYKVYETPDGARPPVLVAFLDVVADPDAAVAGALLPADGGVLAALDARERQYDRVEVTAAVDGAPAGGRVWAYRGRAASRARVHAPDAPVVVQRAYAEAVRGVGAPDPPFAVLELARVDLPA